MILFIAACVVGMIPGFLLFLWLRNGLNPDQKYKKVCTKTLLQGMLCVFPVMAFSAVSSILLRLTGLRETQPLLYRALYTFIVFALSEEIMKYRACRGVLKKTQFPYSWMDVTALMTVSAIGFAMIESLVIYLDANIPIVLIRGFSLPHAGYGYLLGYYLGKSERTGKPAVRWIGFALAVFLHGLYDLSLSEEFLAVNDNLVFLPFLLIAVDLALVVRLVLFVRKAKKDASCTAPLVAPAADPVPPESKA